jgi:signal transduction histidine kinase
MRADGSRRCAGNGGTVTGAQDRRARGARGDERLAAADALVALLARALHLERAALYVARDADAAIHLVAAHGDVAETRLARDAVPQGWSFVLPIDSTTRLHGFLCLARRDHAPLDDADRALVMHLVAGAGDFLARQRLEDDLLRAQALLARADRLSALGTLAAGIAHEIRNPLVSVRTFIQLLPERLHDEEFRTGFRDLALSEIERICGLINDLLAFSRPAPAEREPVDLQMLASQTVRLLDAEARKRGVVLRMRAETVLPAVVADEARMKQVLMNVVLNGIQASPERGAVDVCTRVDADDGARWCVVEIADTGPGIAPEQAERIFDPFFTTKETGSGLGLFIAHRIVTEHGGAILAGPRAEGGTVFSIRLPAEHA